MAKVKICGITRIDDALLACEYGASMIGMIFYDKSPRYIANIDASEIVRQLPENILSVGVFVNPGVEEIRSTLETTGVKAAQIHGEFDRDKICKLNIPIIRAFGIDEKSDFNSIKNDESDYLLLDNKGIESYGGTGKTFDWELIPKDLRNERLILAGGLNIENVSEAISSVKPAFVDISSGVESSPGIKDKTKLKNLLDAVKDANSGL